MKPTTKAISLVLGGAALCAAAGMIQGTVPADTAKVAKTIVNKCANIRENDLVLIEGGTRDQVLLECIAVEVRKLGAHPLIALGSDELTLRLVTEVPERLDAQERGFDKKLAEIIDATITVDYHEQPDLFAKVAPERLVRIREAERQAYQRMLDRGVVGVHLGNDLYPTDARAEMLGISRSELSRIFWNAVNADYDAIQRIGERVSSVLAAGDQVKITAPNGTDLAFKVTNRPVFVSDGVVSDEDRYAKGPAAQVWLPAGEVYVTPVPGTAGGTFVADTFFYEGKLIEGLKLVFKDGRLTSMTASPKSDISLIEKRFKAAPAPAREQFAALDIGINPAIEAPRGSRFMSWIGSGTISVGFGDNTWAGGENEVPFALFAHLTNGTLAVDGRTLIDKGKLVADR